MLWGREMLTCSRQGWDLCSDSWWPRAQLRGHVLWGQLGCPAPHLPREPSLPRANRLTHTPCPPGQPHLPGSPRHRPPCPPPEARWGRGRSRGRGRILAQRLLPGHLGREGGQRAQQLYIGHGLADGEPVVDLVDGELAQHARNHVHTASTAVGGGGDAGKRPRERQRGPNRSRSPAPHATLQSERASGRGGARRSCVRSRLQPGPRASCPSLLREACREQLPTGRLTQGLTGQPQSASRR